MHIKIYIICKKNTKVYILTWHNHTHDVCVVTITKLKTLQKTLKHKLKTTQVAHKKRFQGAKESIMQERLQYKDICDIKKLVMQGQLQCKNVCDVEESRQCKNNCNGKTSMMQKN